MNKKYFKVVLEFDKQKADQIILDAIENQKKGYVCLIESNNLSIANIDKEFNQVVNNALVNLCDGSNVAYLLGKIHGQNFQSYIGNDVFLKYISMGRFRSCFLGNTRVVLDGLKENLKSFDPAIDSMPFMELPFCQIDDFDYKSIAETIKQQKIDIIWVSLGAPKQELFMAKLLPYLDRGIMMGVGAAFNFNAGQCTHVVRAPRWMLKMRLEWLYRAFNEPRKNVPRYWRFVKLLPQLVYQECHNR